MHQDETTPNTATPKTSSPKPNHMCTGSQFCQVCKQWEEEQAKASPPPPPEMVGIAKTDLENLVKGNAFLNQQVSTLGGLCRILLSTVGGALVFNTAAAEDAIDGAEIHILPTRQACPPDEILNLLHQGVDLDESFVAVVKNRPPKIALKMKGARVEERKAKAEKKAQDEATQKAVELLTPGKPAKAKLILLGSSEGEKL